MNKTRPLPIPSVPTTVAAQEHLYTKHCPFIFLYIYPSCAVSVLAMWYVDQRWAKVLSVSSIGYQNIVEY